MPKLRILWSFWEIFKEKYAKHRHSDAHGKVPALTAELLTGTSKKKIKNIYIT